MSSVTLDFNDGPFKRVILVLLAVLFMHHGLIGFLFQRVAWQPVRSYAGMQKAIQVRMLNLPDVPKPESAPDTTDRHARALANDLDADKSAKKPAQPFQVPRSSQTIQSLTMQSNGQTIAKPLTEPVASTLSGSEVGSRKIVQSDASLALPGGIVNGVDLIQQARASAGSVDRKLRESQPRRLDELIGRVHNVNRLEKAFAEAGLVVSRLEEVPLVNGSVMTRVHAGGATYCVRSQLQPIISTGDPGSRVGFITTNCPQ